jgi:hypothetical protein
MSGDAELLPAAGWGAVYVKSGREFAWPLIGWTRSGDGAASLLVGLTVTFDGTRVVTCDSIEGFKCYLPPSEWIGDAQRELHPPQEPQKR